MSLKTEPSTFSIEPPDFDKYLELSRKFEIGGMSPNTAKAYSADFSKFTHWCFHHNREYLPAEPATLCAYLASISDKKYSTIARVCVSIARYHRENDLPSPTESQSVKAVLKGIRRENGIACDAAKPILWAELVKMIGCQMRDIRGRRNAAILAIGWTMALRRSEIVAIDVQDLEITDEGMFLNIRRSKTDQDGKGKCLFVPRAGGGMCPVIVVETYKNILWFKSGPMFNRVRKNCAEIFYRSPHDGRITDQTITEIVKEAAVLIGLSPLQYSAHSLRRGFATECGRLGIPDRIIARQTRHRSMRVLQGYIEAGELTVNSPLTAVYGAPPPRAISGARQSPDSSEAEPVESPAVAEPEPSFHDDRYLD